MPLEIQPPNNNPSIFLKDHGVNPVTFPRFPEVAETLAEVFYLDTEISILARLRMRKLESLYNLIGFDLPTGGI